MKIAFFWTWDFSKSILSWILKRKEVEVALVVSQPDKPVWRKKEIIATPVKQLAIDENIKVSQPNKLRDNDEFFNELKNLELDYIIVVAYWKIVPNEVLDAPKNWCINIHWSILPKYRWASPIQESIKNWDTKTWLTIMYMSEWMDEWDILKIEEIEIDILDKTLDIFQKFQNNWADLVINTLLDLEKWLIKPIKQNEDEATYCSKISKSDWEVDFKLSSAKEIYDKYRSYSPWPWIYSYYNDKKISFEECFFNDIDLTTDSDFWIWDVVEIENEHWEKNKEIWVISKNWMLILKQVKLEWKKTMDINTFINWNKEFLDYSFN